MGALGVHAPTFIDIKGKEKKKKEKEEVPTKKKQSNLVATDTNLKG